MMYNESNKTHHGVDSREHYQETRMYANPANPDNCPVRSLDLYLSKLNPKCNSFFQQPLLFPKKNVWYAAQPIGKNKICAWMGHLSTSAGLSKRYTNHCIRATVATGLKQKGIDLLSIIG
jgi:site-specific recombinase XerD